MKTPHPIETESYRILGERVDLSGWPAPEAAVVARVIHASADLDYSHTMRFSPGAVQAGVEALRSGAPIITDVEMTRHGLSGLDAHCLLARAQASPDGFPTRSAAAIQMAARSFPAGAVVVIGCAPTALFEVIRLYQEGSFTPAVVVGMPVGFVGAADSKQAARACGLVAVTNEGEKGGSAVAAAAVNAMARLAREAR
ncbi:MAG: precorrin-8X methylmutase [Acidimicrobiales bacterium]